VAGLNGVHCSKQTIVPKPAIWHRTAVPYEPPPDLATLSLAEIAGLNAARKLPPVDQWDPKVSGDSLMTIRADGRWFHDGGEIRRPAMIRAFAAIAAAQRGEVTAEVASAHPLSEDQVASLQEKLKAREGRTVKIRTSVDPDLLGGLVVTIGSKRIDSSIRTRLNSLAHAMKG